MFIQLFEAFCVTLLKYHIPRWYSSIFSCNVPEVGLFFFLITFYYTCEQDRDAHSECFPANQDDFEN